MSKKEKTQIGDIIKSLRKEKGFTQETFASEINIPRTTYANYEANKREPSIEMLKKIANALEVPLEVIISMSQINNITKELHDTVKELKSKVNSENFNKEYVEEMLEDVINNDIYFIRLIYNRLFPNNRENIIDNISPSKASNIINSLKDTLEFELYKIKHKK